MSTDVNAPVLCITHASFCHTSTSVVMFKRQSLSNTALTLAGTAVISTVRLSYTNLIALAYRFSLRRLVQVNASSSPRDYYPPCVWWGVVASRFVYSGCSFYGFTIDVLCCAFGPPSFCCIISSAAPVGAERSVRLPLLICSFKVGGGELVFAFGLLYLN
ncbi:unnamed protein product [Calypogeia fissa]